MGLIFVALNPFGTFMDAIQFRAMPSDDGERQLRLSDKQGPSPIDGDDFERNRTKGPCFFLIFNGARRTPDNEDDAFPFVRIFRGTFQKHEKAVSFIKTGRQFPRKGSPSARYFPTRRENR